MNQLLVLDLDGTLLRNDKTVSEETINSLIEFENRNNKIIFATARPPRDAYKYVPQKLRDNPIICYNGACMINHKEILYKKEMSRDTVYQIIEKSEKSGYHQICFEIDDKLYSNFDTSDFFGKAPTEIVDLTKLNMKTAYKVIICNKASISQDFLTVLPNTCKGIVTDNGRLCQIMDQEVSKWNSIQSLVKAWNIKNEDIIAFGDDYNDLDMIKHAGIGVAMGNAEKVVKESANFVTDTNMNEGVAKYLKEHILPK